MTRIIQTLLAFLLGLFMLPNAVSENKSTQDNVISQRIEQTGIAVHFSMDPIGTNTDSQFRLSAGEDAIVTFRVTDANSGQPISGIRPKAWINARLSEQLANEVTCKDKVRSFMAGQLATQPDFDLNSYLILTLNQDKTITVINPQISFNTTKLVNIISLPSNGADWILSKNRNFLYVTMPEKSSVAVIDTTTSNLVGILATGENSMPRRIMLQPDGRYIWVGLDGDTGVVVIDTATNQIAGKVAVGEGLHNIAFTADNRFAYVSNSTANTVTVIDVKKLVGIADIPVGETPIAIAYGSASNLIYVAAVNGGTITAIDPDKQIVVATMNVRPGVVALRFDPDGRYVLAVNQIESTLYAIDSSTNLIIGSAQVVKNPDQIVFTERYAYIRGLGSEKFSLIDLNGLKKGKLAPVDIQAGRLSPNAEPAEIGVANMIAPTPEGNAVVIANAPDRMLYFYQEGMMAPMGTLSNYKRMPHAVMILDRSLHEVMPGVYSAPVKLTKGGNFDVPLLIDQPRIVNCFQVSIADSPNAKMIVPGTGLDIEMLTNKTILHAHKSINLKFKIVDSANKQPIIGLKDVRALIFEPPGVWQQRRSVTEIGGGIYAIKQTFPRAGSYNLMLEVVSRGVGFADLAPNVIKVENNDKSNTKFIQTLSHEK